MRNLSLRDQVMGVAALTAIAGAAGAIGAILALIFEFIWGFDMRLTATIAVAAVAVLAAGAFVFKLLEEA